MTKLLASTALVAMLAAPVAMAQTATTTTPGTTTTMPAETATTMPADGAMMDGDFGYTPMAGDMSAETFIGKRLYSSETEIEIDASTITEIDQSWNDVGEISDLVISQDGEVQAVLTDIGGFLGLGERTVAVSMDALRVIPDGDSQGEYFIVFTANREALENAPEFEWMAE